MIDALEQLAVPGPIPTALSQPFWDAARDHQFALQRCEACATWVFYPRAICPHCWSPRLSWQPASGRGSLRSFTLVHRPGHPGWTPVAPYPLGIVDLAEGPTMLSTLVDIAHDDLAVGMPLAVRFVRVGRFTLPMFTADTARKETSR